MKQKINTPVTREIASSLVLLALIGLCWYALSGRMLDASDTVFLYKDF